MPVDITMNRSAGRVGADQTVWVTVDNQTDTRLPAGTRVFFERTSYFMATSVALGSVEAWTKKKITVTLSCHGGVTVDDICCRGMWKISVQSADRRKKHASSTFFEPDLQHYIAALKAPCKAPGVDKPNILLFGPMSAGAPPAPPPASRSCARRREWDPTQRAHLCHSVRRALTPRRTPSRAGKSSFVQTATTLLSDGDRVLTNVVEVGESATTLTKTIKKYDCGGAFSIWDTWGQADDTYKYGELSMMVDGSLPSGWRLDDMGKADEAKLGKLQQYMLKQSASFQGRMHAVVFMCPIASLNDPRMAAEMTVFFRQIQAKGINPVVLLARLDEAIPELRADPSMKPHFGAARGGGGGGRAAPATQLGEFMTTASRTFGIPRNQVSSTRTARGIKRAQPSAPAALSAPHMLACAESSVLDTEI